MNFYNPELYDLFESGDITIENNHIILTMKKTRLQFCTLISTFQKPSSTNYCHGARIKKQNFKTFRKAPKTNPKAK